MRKKFDDFTKENPQASPGRSADFIRGEVSKAKHAIESNPDIKINDLELKSLILPPDGIKVHKPVEPIAPVKKVNPFEREF